MIIDKELVAKIAHLARLELKPEAEGPMCHDLNKILDWVEKLKEINTDKVEPLIHISEELNVLRKDEMNNSLEHKEALLNAPKKDSDYFRVPRFLGDS